MTEDWELDGRKMPDQVLEYLRKMAVRAVEEYKHSPELVIEVLGLSRSCLYDWLRRYRTEGSGEPSGAGGAGASDRGDGGVVERDGVTFDTGGARL